MKLNKVTITNFRRFKNETTLKLSQNITALIGENDAGKSTFFDALNVFFSENPESILTEQDINSEYYDNSEEKNKIIKISCSFLIPNLTNDDNIKNLYNKNREIEILKEFSFVEKFTVNTYFIVDYSEYLHLIENLNEKPKLQEVREEIYNKIKYSEIQIPKPLTSTEPIFTILKKFAKDKSNNLSQCKVRVLSSAQHENIYKTIKNKFPYFAYFKTDKTNDDNEPEIQKPLNAAVNEAIKEMNSEIKQIEKAVLEKAILFSDNLYNSGFENEILKQLKVDFKNPPNWASIFNLTYKDNKNVPINLAGSGTRRILSLASYIREVKNRRVDKSIIFAIEEPETAQHPNNLIALFKEMTELSRTGLSQFIITTHTPEVAKIIDKDNLVFIQKDGRESRICTSDDKLKLITDTLGILPYLSKVVVCVEGENDIKFLKNINQNIPELKSIIDLEEKQISIIPLNGGNLVNWVNRNYLKGSNVTEIHIYDKDSNSGRNTEKYKEECKKVNERKDSSFCFLTDKREMENYIPKSLIETVFNVDCSSIENWDIEDVQTFIANSQTLFNKKEIKWKLNNELSMMITKQHLEELNAFDEIKKWFEKIKELMN